MKLYDEPFELIKTRKRSSGTSIEALNEFSFLWAENIFRNFGVLILKILSVLNSKIKPHGIPSTRLH